MVLIPGERLKRAIGGIYSFAADKFYNRVVVHGAFRIFGGDLHALVIEQGLRAVSVARGGPLLDMPVGTAYFTVEHARAHRGLVVGVDIAEGMVREAKRLAAANGLDNLVLVQADAHHLPFKNGAFPAELCSNGLQVMPGTETTLQELARVLSTPGTLFISIVGIPLSKVLPERATDHLPALFRTGRDLAAPLKRAGLEVASVRRERLAWIVEARSRA